MRLDLQSPWNLYGETIKPWSVMFSLSGASAIGDADIETTALALWDPIKRLSGASGNTALMGYSYYKSGSTVAYASKTYNFGDHVCLATGYSGAGARQQMEVCILCVCPVGKNSRGREVYLRKWIHDVQASTSDANTHQAITSPSSTLTIWNNGAGPNLNVPVDPTSGVQGGPWQIETHLFTHQMRRGVKKKKGGTATNSVDIPPIELP